MSIRDELKRAGEILWEQLTASSKTSGSRRVNPKDFHFTKNFQAKAASWGLTEADAPDVYRHGEATKDNMLVRRYNGYEIGIYYFIDGRTGQTVITSIWKRD